MSEEFERLYHRLRNAIEAVIRLASERGLGPELPSNTYEVEWLAQQEPNRSNLRKGTRIEGSFHLLSDTLKTEFSNDPNIQDLLSDATEFAQHNGRFMPVFPGGSQRAALCLLLTYFHRTKLLTVQTDIVAEVVRQFQEDITAATAAIEAIFQVSNFSAPHSFDLGDGITFRPITTEDTNNYGRTSILGAIPRGWNEPKLHEQDWICEAVGTTSKDDMTSFNDFESIIDDVASTMNVCIGGRATFRLLAKRLKSPFLQIGTLSSTQDIPISRLGGGTNIITTDDIDSCRNVFAQLKKVRHDNCHGYVRLAFRRLRASSQRRNLEDHVVDCVVGLEALLANDTERIEATFRFRLRGAVLLPSSFGTALERSDLMGELYDLRSRIVHGSAKPAVLERLAPRAEVVLREILLWYLGKGITLGSKEKIRKTIDEALITGGSRLREL
jgi:hypothetical protein